MKKKIIVTGGAGYIGSHTTVELQQAGFDVVVIDNLANSNETVMDGIEKITGLRPTFYKADCNDLPLMREIFEKESPVSGIIHFAASKAVGESVKMPSLYYRNNLVSLLNMIDLTLEMEIKGFVFSSSCTVYGQPEQLPVTEDAPVQPAMSPYGNTKQVGEEIIRDIAYANPALNAILLRYFNPVGAHSSAEIGELPNGVPQNLIPFVAQTAMGLREQLSIFGDDYDTPDGSCVRDYIHVVDLAKAHVVALNRLIAGKNLQQVETFNIGTGVGLSVLEIVSKFEDMNNVKVNSKIVGRREGDIAKVWAQPDKANNILRWRAESSVEETLASAWKWQLKLRERGIM